jgi:hypothetical protein
MPIHDWTRVDDSLFHSFELGWLVDLCRRLNHGALPSSHFAMIESIDPRPDAPFQSLPEPDQPTRGPIAPGDVRFADADAPPVRWVFTTNRIEYAGRAVTVRDGDTHAVVAAVVVAGPQDKRTEMRLARFVQRAVAALSHDIHLLVIDLFPSSPLCPHGIHRAIWDQIEPSSFGLPPDKPLTLAAYSAGRQRTAYVEPVAVGDALTDMPLFLKPETYVPVPLEATYQAEWQVFPARLKGLLEGLCAGPAAGAP